MKIPGAPKISIPNIPAVPTQVTQNLSAGPAQGAVGIGAPQHFDPNNPSVRLDGTVHNPTGIGGDLHVSREVSVNDLKKIPVPDPSLDLPSLGGGSSSGGGGGFSMPGLPSIGNPLSGLSLPDMPGLPDMPSLGNPFSGLSAPDFSLPSCKMPDFGFPDLPPFGLPQIDLPGGGYKPAGESPWRSPIGCPGFRFPELPSFGLPSVDLPDWDLSLADLLPDFWDGSCEDDRADPDEHLEDDTETAQVTFRACTDSEGHHDLFEHRVRLVSMDGSYDQSVKVKEEQIDEDGIAVVHFGGVRPDGRYRIETYMDDELTFTRVDVPGEDLCERNFFQKLFDF
ncbi:MAG: hypothetical protein IPK50_12105 [Fibrobacterota bacterium]|nr:hypothetical protein [Fibrobacterota bacterium]QQS03056.1 MAG: hypothetical protein IPK50_12105 [Fibrobacterota bacterium]